MNPETGPDRDANPPTKTAEWFSSEIKSYAKAKLEEAALAPSAPRQRGREPANKEGPVVKALKLARDLAARRLQEWSSETEAKNWDELGDREQEDRRLATQYMGIPKKRVYVDEAISRMSKQGRFHDSLIGLEDEVLQQFDSLLADYCKPGQDDNNKRVKSAAKGAIKKQLSELDMEPPHRVFHRADAQSVIDAAKNKMAEFSEKLQREADIAAIIEDSYPEVADDVKAAVMGIVMHKNYDHSKFGDYITLIEQERKRARRMESSGSPHFFDTGIRSEYIYTVYLTDRERIANQIRRPRKGLGVNLPDEACNAIANMIEKKLERHYLIRDQLRLGPERNLPETGWIDDKGKLTPLPDLEAFVNKTIRRCRIDWMERNPYSFREFQHYEKSQRANADLAAVAAEGQYLSQDSQADLELWYITIRREIMRAPFELADKLHAIQREARLHFRTEQAVESVFELTAISVELQDRQLGGRGRVDAAFLSLLAGDFARAKGAMVGWVHDAMGERHPAWRERYPDGVPSSESDARGAFDSTESADYRRVLRYACGNRTTDETRTSKPNHPLVESARSDGVLGLLQGRYAAAREELVRLSAEGAIGLADLVDAYRDEQEALGARGAAGG